MGTLLGNLGPNFVSGGLDADSQPPILPPLPVITPDDINRMTLALSSPERQVTLGNQTITYRSIDDLIKARDKLMELYAEQQRVALGKPARSKRGYAYYAGRGYD